MESHNLTINPTFQARVIEMMENQHKIGWNLSPEDLVHIPIHWLSYPEPEASLHFLLGLVYIGFFIMSIVGNGLVIWIFTTAKSLRTASNMFVVNLAICDFIMMLKAPIFIYNSFHRGYAVGHVGCQIFACVGTISGINGGMTNACIAYDRYTTITRPFDGKVTRIKALLMIIGVWIYTMPWAVLPIIEFWGAFVPDGFLTSCSMDYLTTTFDNRVFVTGMFICSYCIPLAMIMYFYSHIVSKVFSHEKLLREQAKKMNVESLRSNQNQANESAEIRIAKAALTVCFMFVASWTPYACLTLIGVYGDQRLITPGVSMMPACTAKMVACIDPYIYAISHPKYRLELQKRLPWLAIKEAEISETRSTVTESSTSNPPAPTA